MLSPLYFSLTPNDPINTPNDNPAATPHAQDCAPHHAQDDEQRIEEWSAVCLEQGFANEWTLAARLGLSGSSEEQIHYISELFGR